MVFFGRNRNQQTSKSITIDYCEDCLAKQVKIDRLEEELKQLKAQLRYRNKKDNKDIVKESREIYSESKEIETLREIVEEIKTDKHTYFSTT